MGVPTLREAFGHFPTGVAIITTLSQDGQAVGITCNSFSSVSLDPPLVLWSLRLASSNIDHFNACSHFVVNIMSRGSEALCRRFAETRSDKFDGMPVSTGVGGVPALPHALARFECRKWDQIDAGDHTIFLGLVEEYITNPKAADEALVFYRGQFA